eukprot:m.145750 g.145750  ORF g.145750 m.145750 type:complete len:1399 (-) comp14955_c0_seq2:168-4364(-)
MAASWPRCIFVASNAALSGPMKKSHADLQDMRASQGPIIDIVILDPDGALPTSVLEETDLIHSDRVYVCEDFDSKATRYLIEQGCRVVGPMYIMDCAHRREPPSQSSTPILNSVMRGLVICVTGCKVKQKDKIHKRVEMMGGKVERAFTANVTHLVARGWGSEKCKIAIEIAKPVMQPKWVDACWQLGQRQMCNALDETLMKYRLPIFFGSNICVTGMEPDERKRISVLTKQNGGIYSAELTCDVTHLLAAEASGSKYLFARQRKIPVVHPQWFDESVRIGGQADISAERFQVAGTSESSSMILAPVEETRCGFELTAEEKDIKVTHNPENQYFDGMFMFLSEIANERQQLMSRLIRAGGGFRTTEISSDVTHVIFFGVEPSSQIVQKCELLAQPPIFVRDTWVLECAKEGKEVSVESYLYNNGKNLADKAEVVLAPPAKKIRREVIEPENVKSEDMDILSLFTDDCKPNSKKKEDHCPPAANKTKQEPNDESEDEVKNLFYGLALTVKSPPIPKASVDLVQSTVITQGGKFTELEKEADFIVMLQTWSKSGPPKDPFAVSTCWFEACMDAGRLWDPLSFPLFVPCKVTGTPLTSTIICTSGFEEPYRGHIENLCTAAGAHVLRDFKRSKCTHLICCGATGKKYEKSFEWGIPAVSIDWLIKSAECGIKLPHQNFLVDKDGSMASLRDISVQKLKENMKSKQPSEAKTQLENPSPCEVKAQLEKPTTQNETFKPSFDLREVNVALETPGRSPCQTSSQGSALAKIFSENLENAVAKRENSGKGILSGLVLTFSKASSKEQNLKNLAVDLGAKVIFDLSMETTHFIFQGRLKDRAKDYREAKRHSCSIVSPSWISACAQCGSRLPEEDFPLTYNPKLSLEGITLSQKPNTPIQESKPNLKSPAATNSVKTSLRRSSRSTRKIASPHVQELKPRKKMKTATSPLTVVTSAQDTVERQEQNKSPKVEDQETAMLKSAVEGFIKTHQAGKGFRRKRRPSVSVHSKLGETKIETTSISAMEGREHSGMQRAQSGTSTEDNASGSTRSQHALISEEDHDYNEYDDDYEPEESSQAVVTYDDPDRAERLRLIAHVQGRPNPTLPKVPDKVHKVPEAEPEFRKHNSVSPPADVREDSQFSAKHDGSTNQISMNTTIKTLEDTAVQSTPTLRILLSALENSEKSRLIKKIENLNGIVLESRYWDPTCTHLVVGDATRSEKFLAACASGIWVLQPKFVQDSYEAGEWIKEEPYEYGAKEIDLSLSSKSSMAKTPDQALLQLAVAPKKWRQKLNSKEKAFKGWKVLLCASSSKQDGFKRLLEAGDAQILAIGSKFQEDHLSQATHAFVESKVLETSDLDLDDLLKRGIQCLRVDYIAEYLSRVSLPPKEMFAVEKETRKIRTSPRKRKR